MNLLSVESLSKSYGSRALFDNLSFGVSKGEKKALVARNGFGKTTLLNILKGKEIADSGNVVFRRDIIVSFLDQEPELDPEKSILDLLLNSKNRITDAVVNYEALLEKSMTNPTPDVLGKLDVAMQMMTDLDAWDYENKVKELLGKLNIHVTTQLIGTLSGGQKKRVALVQTLIQEPDLIILDEPTNHLDIDMIEWLESYLNKNDAGILMVTHDRYFLDEVCTEIMEIENHQLYTYKGDFGYYLEKKAERLMAESSEVEKAKNTYRKELEWMRRQPKARGTKAKSRITSFYEVEKKAKHKTLQQAVTIEVKMNRLGNKIVEMKNVSKAFGDLTILDKFSYTFKTGEKIGIVGKNGMGKSTFLNMLLGLEPQDSGSIQTGETIVFGYYSQSGMIVKEDERIIETIRNIADVIPLASGASLTAAQLLTRFNFAPDKQFGFVSALSGGEKRRLFLLTILMKNPNFLILDEPTNDLDIVTLQTLEDFLLDFKGCVLTVSHDRYFLDKMSEHVFVFEGEGQIRDFPGNYSEYREWKDDQPKLEREERAAKEKTQNTSLEKVTAETQKKKLSYNEQREFESLEKEIAELELRRDKNTTNLIEAGSDHEKIQKISHELSSILTDIETKTLRWMELGES